MDHLRVRSPVEIMTDRFLEQRCCSKSDIRREVAIASIPYIVICISLSLYVVFGALTFSAIDDFMDQDTFATKCFFIFTTLTTIGYGDLTPRNPLSKLFCLLYVGAGVPLLLMALINFGQLFAELFWALITSVTTSVHVDPESRRKIPISVAVAFLVLHSLFGAGIFTYWLNEQPFITAIYFSFVSITTIGFGDVIVSPQNNFDTVILTFYLVSGIVIMTTFINGVVDHVVWIHYLGRGPTSIRKNVVWFGGELMTVQELILLAASSFEVSPRQLRETLRNLDEIIALALNDELRKKSKVFLNNGTFITDGALVNNEESRIKHRLKTASSLSRMSTPYHEKNQNGKIQAVESSARRQELVFLVAFVFGSFFALVNFIFAFYNLFRIVNMVARTLKGMRMKINLAEKALKERRLPSNLMARLQDTDDGNEA